MGNWQAMRQLEWDIVQETFTPYNRWILMKKMSGALILDLGLFLQILCIGK